MTTITHTLAPMTILAVGQLLVKRKLDWKVLWLVGLAGASPDLLDPHVSLEDRMSSWSHSLVGLSAVSLLLFTFALLKVWVNWTQCALMISAYVLHLLCDAVSGGIPFLLPGEEHFVGGKFIPFKWWLICDAVFILSMILIWGLARVKFQRIA